MAQTNVNIRMDENLKKEFDEMCNELGMNMTTAITIFAKQVVQQQGIPFAITRKIPNAVTAAAIKEVEAMKNDPSLGKAYTDVDEMMEALLK